MSKCNITNQKLEPFMSFGKFWQMVLLKKKIKTEKFYELKIGFNEEISLFKYWIYQSFLTLFTKIILFLLINLNL